MISKISILLTFMVIMVCCNDSTPPPEEPASGISRKPEIFPDYKDITIPLNIAPLNFVVKEDGKKFKAAFEGVDGALWYFNSRHQSFRFSSKKWRKLLTASRGTELKVTIFKKEKHQWTGFLPYKIHVANESIDPFLAYRLIPPGYETWSGMGLYQRDLTSFKEKPIIENKYVENNCVNCHSFCNGNSENMLFHMRGSMGGTMIKRGDNIEKINIKTDETLSAGVYPSWHPSGNFIAFSTNKIEQYFHANRDQTIEVLDRHSDLIIYNTESKEITHVPGTKGDQYMETFPSWSPDGKYLYFSRTEAKADTPYDSIRYDIYRIKFDSGQGQFGESEPVFIASDLHRSASFPRISPDGKYLLCTIHNYGTFPIWHPEADLCLVDLSSGKSEIPEVVNSDAADSYHTWAQNNRWIVFSSRRFDGQYTKLYISYLNKDGQFQRAFLLPQRKPDFYNSFFYSYNRPELISSSIQVDQRDWIKAAGKR